MRARWKGLGGEMEVWPVIHAERKALASDLHGLNEAQWSSRSLCTDWTVRDVLAHMTATARLSPPSFFVKLAGSGFSLTRLQGKDISAEKGSSPADTLSGFESIVTSTGHPPGPADTMLGETIIHSEDIRRPLGLHHAYPTEAVVQAANFFKGSNLIIGTKRRITGLKLRATDTNWSTGAGPEVAGPILALLMAMTGRKAATAELTGEGVETLASRP
jgi:uncharacterized protein (TIGR03083 family)